MVQNVIGVLLVAVIVALATYLVMQRRRRIAADAASRELFEAKGAGAIAAAEHDARQAELRKQIVEAREREDDSKVRATEAERKFSELAAELKTALEEKGKFQNEATRVEEAKAAILEGTVRFDL